MSRYIIYRFEVTATVPLADDDNSADYYTEPQAVSVEHRASLNRALFALLKRSRLHDCDDWDCELLDFTVEEDAPRNASEDARDAEADRQWKENR